MSPLPPPRRRGRPKASDTVAVQADIIEIAKRLFFEQGVAAASMDAIAKAAGITKQTLYSRFPSKDELYRAVIDDIMARWREQQGPVVRDDTTLEEALHEHTVRTLDTATREGSALLTRFLNVESSRDPGLARAVIGPIRAKGIQDIECILDAFPAPGHAAPIDQRAAAEYFFMGLVGKINDLNNFRDEISPDALAAWATTAVHLFLEGYSVSPANRNRTRISPA
jgi:AcrR family transcriptional regulator